VAASTQNQALSALLFLYREVLEKDFGWLDDVVWANKPQRLPVVFTPDEALAIIVRPRTASRRFVVSRSASWYTAPMSVPSLDPEITFGAASPRSGPSTASTLGISCWNWNPAG
jgi:hypothetical protein